MVVRSVSFSGCPPGNLSLCHQHEGDHVHGGAKTCLAILCAVPVTCLPISLLSFLASEGLHVGLASFYNIKTP